MFSKIHQVSTVTAVLPAQTANAVIEQNLVDSQTSALIWNSRGTLLQDHWWQRYVPPISPRKSVIQMLVPNRDVAQIVGQISQTSNLHQQAIGAVFASPCEYAYIGSQFPIWPGTDRSKRPQPSAQEPVLKENLSAIYCIVSKAHSDKVSRAAINAGAHGPIVYYSEGHGLRDRLGWLRITKEVEKEVLMVVTTEADAEDVFQAMAKAGELHLPGRGFMYRLAIDKGLFNLPSRVSRQQQDASIQQIIHAIDHLSGHTHWRDQTVFQVGGGRGAGLDFMQHSSPLLQDRVCMACVVNQQHSQQMMDLLLNNGAPGLNLSFARMRRGADSHLLDGGSISTEYAMIRCITDKPTAEQICATIDSRAEAAGLHDLSVLLHQVPRVATYVPGSRNYRKTASREAEPLAAEQSV